MVQRLIYSQDQKIGTVILVRSLDDLKSMQDEFKKLTFTIWLIIVILVIFAALWIEKSLTKPLIELVSVAERVASEKDLQVRARKMSDDEFGRLTTVFNNMLDSIGEANEKLVESKEQMETRVIERTDDLKKANKRLQSEIKVRIKKNQELLNLQNQLGRQERLANVGQVSSNIAHELRNPMAAIRNSVYFLRNNLSAVDKSLEHLEIIDQQLSASDDVIEHLKTIIDTRSEIKNILDKTSKKFVIVVGPCSIHDIDAAKEYAIKLKTLKNSLSDNSLLVMRVYFEKPRTVIGWKGLINDPDLDGSFKINNGIKIARQLLIDLSEMNIPCGHEFLDLVSPQYLSDLISWGAIGARTTESQSHRELASGLSCPVGFKNGTDGSIQIAIDAMNAARHSHSFLSVTKEGKSAIFNTAGNNDCHIILRGGNKKTNFSSKDVRESTITLENNNLKPNIMIDASHANSKKDYKKQSTVVEDVKQQICNGEKNIIGIMLESNLVEGNQKINSREKLKYGQSITDSCIGWNETEEIILSLDEALKNNL